MRDSLAPFPYQVAGAAFLSARKGALLADEPGLGKTAQAILACASHGIPTPVIGVVCPASVRENWRREFARFWQSGPYILRVESYDKVARDPAVISAGGRLDYLVIDEGHFLKSRTAKRTKAIFGPKCDGAGGLVALADRVYVLTATPTPNNPSELWPMLRAVMPGAISPVEQERGYAITKKPLSYWAFVQKYCLTRDNGFGIEIVKGKNLGELRERIAPFILRRKKADVLKDLPPIRFDTLPLEGRVEDLDAWGAAEVAKALAEGGIEGLAKIAPHVATLRRLTGLAKVAPAVEWIKDWLEAGGRKLVLFAYHRDVISGLFRSITGVRAVGVDGSTSSQVRQEHIDQFQNDPGCKVFIGQIQAAGTGITLTAASDVLFVESSWVPAENEQAAMRVHRIGQKNACLVRFATLVGSIDEDIQRAVLRKATDIARLFN